LFEVGCALAADADAGDVELFAGGVFPLRPRTWPGTIVNAVEAMAALRRKLRRERGMRVAGCVFCDFVERGVCMVVRQKGEELTSIL